MSEIKEQQPAYISRVHLKGYKSIRDLEIDFKAGLNIIIGPNGSGKTNFLEFLCEDLKSEEQLTIKDQFYRAISSSDSTMEVMEGNEIEIDNRENCFYLTFEGWKNGRIVYRKFKLYENNIYVGEQDDEEIVSSPKEKLRLELSHGMGINPTKVNFNNLFNEDVSIIEIFQEGHHFHQLRPRLGKGRILSYFNPDTLFCMLIINLYTDGKNTTIQNIEELVKGDYTTSAYERLVSPLRKITLIEDIRLLKENIKYDMEQYSIYTISNIQNSLQFLVRGQWFFFNQLSDGTKRLFYLILSTLSQTGFLLLEEPELGIHPDQLYKLMDFLKEQSETKQIVITTHSPEVLNILEKNELDRIIIARYDNEKGTQMHHLSPHKIKKGQMYMDKVGYLSDFWVHSNLEEYEAEEYEVE
jgi:predicted ATPase